MSFSARHTSFIFPHISIVIRSCVLVCLASMFLLTGCSPSNYVRLRYESEYPAQTLSAEAQTAIILEFKDHRPTEDIGIRSDETPFIPVTSVPAWFSLALEQELQRRGFKTIYVSQPEKAQQIQKESPEATLVTGMINTIWIKEINQVDYAVSMNIDVILNAAPATTYRSTLNRQGIPFSDITESHLTESLRDILTAIADDITQKIQ